MSDVIFDFRTLFDGRGGCFGTEAGGMVEDDGSDWWGGHLIGSRPIGVYPMVPRTNYNTGAFDCGFPWVVKWGCVDLDVKGASHVTGYESHDDAYTAARNLRTALKLLHLRGWIEITRSGGYHVWVFAEEWVEAKVMRRALLVACEMAAVPPTEVNPKSEGFDDPDTLGNYVRLPYPGGLSDAHRSLERRVVWDDDGYPLLLRTFLADALEDLAEVGTLKHVAKMWKPPVPERTFDFEENADLADAMRQLSGLAYTIVTNPPLEGQDRSSRLFKLAHECKASGITPSEAALVLEHADQLHGQKYVLRQGGGRAQIETTVRKAYST